MSNFRLVVLQCNTIRYLLNTYPTEPISNEPLQHKIRHDVGGVVVVGYGGSVAAELGHPDLGGLPVVADRSGCTISLSPNATKSRPPHVLLNV